MPQDKQPGGFHKVFSLAALVYASLSLLFAVWVYAAVQFHRLTYEPMILVGLFIGDIILLYFVKMDWKQDLFEWRGIVAAGSSVVSMCRWILGISLLAFAAQLGWLYLESQSATWQTDRQYKTGLIFQTVSVLQTVLSLLFLFLSLFGSRAFTSKRFRRLGYSPVVETGRWARQTSTRKRRRDAMR